VFCAPVSRLKLAVHAGRKRGGATVPPLHVCIVCRGKKGILELRPVMPLWPLSLATFLPEATSQVSEEQLSSAEIGVRNSIDAWLYVRVTELPTAKIAVPGIGKGKILPKTGDEDPEGD